MNETYTMYGAGFSYYSGKLRSTLRKKGIPFREITPSAGAYRWITADHRTVQRELPPHGY